MIIPANKRQTSSKWALTLSERENAANFLLYTTVKPFTYLSHPFCFKCLYCDEKQLDIVLILQHTSTHTIPTRDEMMKDVLKKGKKTMKVDISELKCRLCDILLSDLENARKHLTDEHSTVFTSSGNGMIAYNLKTINGVFSCHLCTEKFNSFFLLNKHISVHYSNAICDTCGKGFVSHKRLLEHKEIHQKRQYTCDKCKIVFSSIHKLKYHKDKVHMGSDKVKLSKCQHCSERFEYHYEKMKHLSDKHGISFDFKCVMCDEIFKTRKSLGSHKIKFHMQSILCDVCKKPFSERSHLKKHMAMHTEERNFGCPLCTKTYRYEKNLKQHMRLHNPDWKFACSQCWVGFNSKIEFRKHNNELHP